MCKYYHPELAGCCYAQKDTPKVSCKGERQECEIPNSKGFPEDCGRYLIRKVKRDGTVIWEHEIIKDDELIFTFANTVDELLDDVITSFRITKLKLDGRSIDGKDSDGKL